MSDLQTAAQAVTAARDNFLKTAKQALNEALVTVFMNAEVENVAWGQKHSEYNDEGMYPGINGPYVNVFDDSEYDFDDLLQGYSYNRAEPTTFQRERKLLKEVLEAIGAETLALIVGDDEHVVTATRVQVDLPFTLTATHVGW